MIRGYTLSWLLPLIVFLLLFIFKDKLAELFLRIIKEENL
jgi:hypothetical protein